MQQHEMVQIGLFDYANEFLAETPAKPKRVIKERPLIDPALFYIGKSENMNIKDLSTLPEGGNVSKIKTNISAIKIAKKFQDENILSTEEKAQLIQYVGWGGVSQAFDPNHKQYSTELKEVLTDEEYRSARKSILNSHYTPTHVIKAMWKIATHMGFKQGSVAEFGAGTGHFLGMAPAMLQSKVDFTTVEIDKISSLILNALYPQAIHHNAPLEKIEFKNQFDLVIGNVPFGQEKIYDKKYPKFNLHNYFIARSIDALKEDGIAILLTSSSTMDSKSPEARKYFSERASFIGAIRLPNITFKANAGTEVVTDILVFHKNQNDCGQSIINIEEVETADNTGAAFINEYFAKLPQQMYGQLSNTGRMYGNTGSTTLVNKHEINLKCQLLSTPEAFPANIIKQHKPSPALSMFKEPEEEISAPANVKDYSIFLHEDSVYESFNGRGNLLRNQNGQQLSNNDIDKAKSFIVLKDYLNKLLSLQLDEYAGDNEVESTRRLFNQEHDLHVKKFGYINQKLVHKHLVDDPDYIKLAAAENVNEKIKTLSSGKKSLTKEYSKGDIFFQRTQFPWKEPILAKNIVEAGIISHAYRHEINLEYIKKMMNLNTPKEAKQYLLDSGEFFENPETKVIELKSQYLSGNVAKKLEAAEKFAVSNSEYKNNVSALIAIQPAPLQIEDIDFKLGSYWLPAETIKNWIFDKLKTKCEVEYHIGTDKWELSPDYHKRYQITDYKISSMDVFDIILLTLNLKDPIVRVKIIDRDGNEKYVIDQEETLAARQIQQEMVDSYKSFVLNDEESSQKIENNYNEFFNNHVDREYHLPVFDIYPNAAEYINGERFLFRNHQKKAVSRCIEGNSLLAHCVGSGKTAVMITAAMELKRLQLATKSLIVVQNATLEQFAAFAPKLYPNARILVAEKKDLVKAKRKRFLSKIGTCNWDIVIMAQSSFDMIKNDPEIEKKYFQEQIDELDEIMEELRNNGARYSLKDVVRSQKQLQGRLDKLSDKINEEDIVYFQELGIDALFVDEAHAYKKNFFVTKKERIKGLDTSASQKSFGLSVKIKTIREKTNGRNIYFATGTPVTNTLAELWNMVRYISPETLEDYHIETFDQFASTFTETETALEIDAAGRFKMVTRFSKYTNVAEMSKMFKTVADVVLSEDLKDVKRPPIKGGAAKNINISRSENISTYMEYLGKLYEWYENLDDKREYSHIPLIIYGQSRKATIDMRLIDSRFPDDPASKLNTCVNNLFDKYREYDFQKGAQVVFSDLYQNKVDNTVYFNAWGEIKRKLILKGIPVNEIAVISEFTTDKQRADLFRKVNSGEIRIVIGSTIRLGTGVNIQERLVVAHHIDAPFRPSDMEQRDGRIIRQGNIFEEVEIFRYGIEQTLDAGMYQILERKQKFINDAMKGRASRSVKELNDTAMDYATFSATISGNEKLKRKVVLETSVRQLKILEMQFYRSQRRNKYTQQQLENNIPLLKKDFKNAEKLIGQSKGFSEEDISISMKGIDYNSNNSEQMEALHEKILQDGIYVANAKSKRSYVPETVMLGEVATGGLKFNLSVECHFHGGESSLNFKLSDYNFSFLNITNEIKMSSSRYLVTIASRMIEKNKVELEKLKRIIISDELKLENIQKTLIHEFAHSEKLSKSQIELKEIIFELNAQNSSSNESITIGRPQLSEFFPEIFETQIINNNILVEAA